MIVKQNTRNSPSFAQLIRYMEQGRLEKDPFLFASNLTSSFGDLSLIADEFRENSQAMKLRKERYSLTSDSLLQLRELNVPDSICVNLELMKDRKYSSRAEFAEVAHALLGNSYLKHRVSLHKSLHITGKNLYLYHDIISFKEERELFLKHPEIFQRTFQKWVDVRYKNCLVYGVAHLKEGDKPHIHIMASANGRGEQRKIHFSKKEFKAHFLEMQQLHQELQHEYPELTQSKVFDRVELSPYAQKRSRKKRENTQIHEQKKQTHHKPTRNKKTTVELQKIIQSSQSLDVMKERMEQKGYTLYSRGQTYGVQTLKGRKYRLKTLGLADLFHEQTRKIAERELNKEHLQQHSALLEREGQHHEISHKLFKETSAISQNPLSNRAKLKKSELKRFHQSLESENSQEWER